MKFQYNKIRTFDEYLSEYKKSVEDPEGFWADKAENFYWRKKWDKVLEWNFTEPSVKWFINGKVNITENCLDRHLETRGGQTAIIWQPNDPEEREIKLTYRELHEKVCVAANMLKNNGAKKGDRICIYMPMVPELAIAVLACARIGAIHSVVFAGFSAKSLADRVNDADCNIVLTSDGSYRGAKSIGLKAIVDEALEACQTVKRVIVLKRTGEDVNMLAGRDVWWDEELAKVSSFCEAEEMDAEDMLFVLYTSGSTGKPKGVVHTIGGYMVFAEYSFLNVFQYNDGDIFWCTADIGWVTGHTYIVYGPLLAGATTLMFEGIPTWPDAGRFWEVIDKYKVNIFYTAPTAIRALQAFGDEYVTPYDLRSLRVLGTVGEPINEEAWEWYHNKIGKGKCPIVDTWWQTETGGILISPLAGITKLKPSYATLPLPGVQPVLIDQEGNEIKENKVEGNLCIKFPWPGIIRTTYGDHERCRLEYFTTYKGLYFTGDGCKRDEDGFYRITGRVDDVINVSGHRFGTAEIEDAIDEHPSVVETAVVGYPHEIKGQGIYAYVITHPRPLPKGGESQCSKTPSYETADPALYKKLREKAEKMRGKPTEAESILWKFLRANQIGYHFRRQHIIGRFIVDFVCLKKMLVIELDGKIHEKQKEEDELKTSVLKEKGFKVIRFKNEEIIAGPEGAVSQIKSELDKQKTLPLGEDLGGAADRMRKEILDKVTEMIGPIAKPDKIQFVDGLPKTRSGKIMRRILRKVAEGDTSNLGDISTLLDPSVVEEIKSGALN